MTIRGNGGPLTDGSVPTLHAPGGRVQLASVASPGDVLFSPLELAPDLQVDGLTRLGRIDLSQGAFLDVSSNGGGSVLLRSGQLRVDGAWVFADNTGPRHGAGVGLDLRIGADAVLTNGARLTTDSLGAGHARELRLTAGRLSMDDAGIASNPYSSGHGGNLGVHVGTLTLTDGAQISTGTAEGSVGRGGELRVAASEAISISGEGSGLFSNTFGGGDAGRLAISAPLLTMDAGLIEAGPTRGSQGHGSEIEVRVGRLMLTGGARIDSGTQDIGRGGELRVVASDSISIAGRGSGLFSSTEASGDAGRLVVATPLLTLTDGALLSTSTLGTGRGGELTVTASEALTIAGRDSGLFGNTFGSGEGGDVQVTAQHIQLRDGGEIAARSADAGDAGTIRIHAGETFRSQNGAVITASARAGGGTITLTAGRLVQLIDSDITTSVRGGGRDAGNLTLTAPFVVAEGSQIIANAFGGRGGNILINAGVFLADPVSLVSASSALGIQGTVNIQAPVTSLSGTLAPLPQAVESAAALLPARCAARRSGGTYSSLVLGGWEGLPAEPGGVLPSPLVLEEGLVADPALSGAPHPPPSAARFALLAGHEQGLPRLGCPP